MLRYVYGVTFILSVLLIVNLVSLRQAYMNSIDVLVFVAMAISNLGFYEMAGAKSLDVAMLANKISYLGGCYIPFLTAMTVGELCKERMSKWISILGFLGSSFVLSLIFIFDDSNLYYASIELITEGNVTFVIKEYGPLHNAFVILLIGYTIVNLIMIVQALSNRKEISYRSTILLCVMLCMGIVTYIVEKVMDFRIELLPFTYVIGGYFMLLAIKKVRMYDVSNLLAESLSEAQEYGFVTFDMGKRYIGSNRTAKLLFKELAEIEIDSPMNKVKTPLFELIKESMILLDKKGVTKARYINCGNLEIRCTLKHITGRRNNKFIGYYVELVDDTEERKYVRLLNNYNSQLEQDVAEKTDHIEQIQNDIILSMADIVESRDSNTGGHVKRTSKVVRILVEKLRALYLYQECDDNFFECVIKAAPLHDFGKIAIDDNILKKPGHFTDEEFNIMKAHTNKGAKIVRQILCNVDDVEFLNVAVNVAHYHHEKWNGKGYPDGLKGEEIPLEARIMALADVFDALVCERCYKNRYSDNQVFRIIEDSLGSHFDPKLGSVFILCRKQLERIYDEFEEQSN